MSVPSKCPGGPSPVRGMWEHKRLQQATNQLLPTFDGFMTLPDPISKIAMAEGGSNQPSGTPHFWSPGTHEVPTTAKVGPQLNRISLVKHWLASVVLCLPTVISIRTEYVTLVTQRMYPQCC